MKIVFTKQFRRDVDLCKSRGWKFNKYKEAASYLESGQTLPSKFKDHALGGNWKGCREFHFAPDHLIIYCWYEPPPPTKKEPTPEIELIYMRMGSHSDLFE